MPARKSASNKKQAAKAKRAPKQKPAAASGSTGLIVLTLKSISSVEDDASYRAICRKGDLTAPVRESESEAAADGIAHQNETGNAAHLVDVHIV